MAVADTSSKYTEDNKDQMITFDEFFEAYGKQEWQIVQVHRPMHHSLIFLVHDIVIRIDTCIIRLSSLYLHRHQLCSLFHVHGITLSVLSGDLVASLQAVGYLECSTLPSCSVQHTLQCPALAGEPPLNHSSASAPPMPQH